MSRSFKAILIIFVSILILMLLTRILEPKYATNLIEGSFISEYYKEEKNHEVIFIGDCEVYSSFSPMEIYQTSGITSYVRGTPQQLIWQSYYILEETLKYEKPKVVVLSMNCMKYDEPVSEPYNRLTIDKMKWSKQKIDIINASKTENENIFSYLFPILRYHDRWDELSGEDFKYLFTSHKNTYNGYMMVKDIKPVENLPTKRPLIEYQFSEKCYGYLDNIVQLCKNNDIQLIIIKAPSIYPYWYDEYDKQLEEYAKEKQITYINFLYHIEEIGLDYSADTYDSGQHLNLTGAEKLSKYFANYLKENYELTDYRNNPEVNTIYNQKIEEYNKAKEN